MPRYYNYKMATNGQGVILLHSDGFTYAPSRIAAEQTLRASVHNWAAEDTSVARQQMDLLTKLVREQ